MKNLMKGLKSGTKVIITGNTSDHNFDIGQEVFFSTVTQDNQSAILYDTEDLELGEFWFVNLIDFCTTEDFERTKLLDKVQDIINSQEADNAMQLLVMTKRIEDLENTLTKIIDICEESDFVIDTDSITDTAYKALYYKEIL